VGRGSAGNWYFTGRIGVGLGGGVAFDPFADLPGPEPIDPCKGGAVLAVSAKADMRVGPFAAGAEAVAARNYRDHVSEFSLLPEFSMGPHFRGFGGSMSAGADVTLYLGR
jgi:hypothetical protein